MRQIAATLSGSLPPDSGLVITSAYRPESTGSAHQRGEAVDIALRPVPTSKSDPRIAQLFAIGQSVGFVTPVGDTIDEWNNPQEKTSAGHIHVEFNLKPDGKTTFCDNTIVKVPPTDLVALTGFPLSGVSDARVRPCMLDKVIQIFNAATPDLP